MSLVHDLKLPGTCMLVFFFGETSFIWASLDGPDDSFLLSCLQLLKQCGLRSESARDLLC